ncbi:hypothetical protein THZB04_10281 [Vibrio owensii]|nr:hypothetical protein THZB04_10281 [Vibrio owensii]
MTAALVYDALSMDLFRRNFLKEVVVHSYRVLQYCSKDHRDLITTYNPNKV